MAGEDSTESRDHHLPAVEDWPRGFGEASWWPFLAAIGATGLYVAAGLYILGRGENPIVGPRISLIVFMVTTALFLTGLYGWVYHAFVRHFRSRDSAVDTDKFRWGMWLFLGSEIATFGAGFTYYFFIRIGPWPPGPLPELLSSLVLVNTLILVISSVTLHFAHQTLRKGNQRRFLGWLVLTFLLGTVFVGGQLWEYYEFIVHGGFTITQGVYASAFFGLTGLHGLHVSLGIVLLGILLIRGLYGQYSAERHTSVTTVSMYWHFVDIVWLFLVVTLYVGATI